jgi:alkylhydroperoxidase/carboxymuconolactone decarboxylase family protein YurZ
MPTSDEHKYEPPHSAFETGLDPASDAPLSAVERESTLDWYRHTHGEGELDLVPFAAFLIDNLPAHFRRYRHHAAAIATTPEGQEGLPQAAVGLLWVHLYANLRDDDGVLYQVIAARRWGANKDDVLGVLAYAFLEAGPLGMNSVARGTGLYLRDWHDEDGPPKRWWPPSWGAAETRPHGRPVVAPPKPSLLAALHPAAGETETRRVAAATTGPLPAQLYPLMTLHLATARLQLGAIRRAAHQARQTGATRHQVVQTLWWGLLYGGQTGVGEIDDELRDLLEDWT